MEETIKSQLENAMNNTHPIRLIHSSEWGLAGEFTVNTKRYAFMGSLDEKIITCRCVEDKDYANRWYNLIITWIGDDRSFSLGTEC